MEKQEQIELEADKKSAYNLLVTAVSYKMYDEAISMLNIFDRKWNSNTDYFKSLIDGVQILKK